MIKKKLRVNTNQKSYDILIGNNLINNAGNFLQNHIKNQRVFVITNKTINKLYYTSLEKSLTKKNIKTYKIIIGEGENHKNIKTINSICSTLLNYKINRDDTLIAFGGGVIGDIVGFTASITLRGVNFIQIPTTLLAQVDSSVGGKTGINTKVGKNLIGTFFQPNLVLADVSLLRSLSHREFLAGYAEVIKYGLIMDKSFFNWLLKNERGISKREVKYIIEIVFRSCKNKAKIVNKDENEKNIRALLNFGHTFGHAIESLNNYKKSIIHGEAVSVGILMAIELSLLEGKIKKEIEEKVKAHFHQMQLKSSIPNKLKSKISVPKFINAMQSDKKVKDNTLNLILLNEVGNAIIVNNFSKSNLRKVIKKHIE